jgi:hypothetical protein
MNIYFKELGYTTINKSSSINSIKHYTEIIMKALNPSYDKCVFYINLNKVKSLDLRKQIKKAINCNTDEDDIIIFINKDNYAFFNNSAPIPRIKINEFLEIEKGQMFKCLVCMKDDLETINQCGKCSASYCRNCIIKSLDIQYLTSREIPVHCMICKHKNGTLKMG